MTDAATVGRYPFAVRAVLVQLAVIQGLVGAYALFWPVSFFEDFPVGLGWVEVLPAYNEHLTRDVGALFLATAFLLGAAAVRLERRLVGIALISFLIFSLPHTVWHLFNLEPYSTGNAIGNAVTLAATVLLPLWALWAIRRPAQERPDVAPSAGEGRIEGVPDSTRNPLVRMSYMVSRRRFGAVMEPMRIFAHNPTVMAGYAMKELASERSRKVPERIKHLATMRAAMLPGCEWCLDFGSSLSAEAGVSEEDMRELALYRESERFTEAEKLVLDYATGISRSPVEVSDQLFAGLREHFDEAQLVELTDLIALENYRARFNWAFGIEGQGFSEGSFCVPPEARPATGEAPVPR